MIGGLVAQNEGSITNSNVNGSSITGTASQAGGLAGKNSGSIAGSNATNVNVSGAFSFAGGLAGVEFRQHLGVDFVRHGEPANHQSLRSVRRPCRPQ